MKEGPASRHLRWEGEGYGIERKIRIALTTYSRNLLNGYYAYLFLDSGIPLDLLTHTKAVESLLVFVD